MTRKHWTRKEIGIILRKDLSFDQKKELLTERTTYAIQKQLSKRKISARPVIPKKDYNQNWKVAPTDTISFSINGSTISVKGTAKIEIKGNRVTVEA